MDVSVRFDRSSYELKYDSSVLTYREGPRVYGMKSRACSKARIDRLVNRYRSLNLAYKSQKARDGTPIDVVVTGADGKRMQVARGSPFGAWLREMPKGIMYLNAEMRASCKL